MFAKVGKRFSLIPLKFHTLIVTRYCNYNLSLQPLTLKDIWIVQVKPIAPFTPPHPRCHRTPVRRRSSRSKQNAKIKIVDHTISELIFDTCTRARNRPSLAL